MRTALRTHMDQTPQSTEEQASSSASFFEDFIDIFYAPSAVFERRRNSGVWPSLLVVTGLFAILSYVGFTLLGPAIDAEISRNMAKAMQANPQLTPEMMEGGARFARLSMMAGAVLMVPIAVLLVGIVLWLVGKLFDATEPLRAAFFIATMSWMPRMIESLLASLQGLMMDPTAMTSAAAVSLTPARFMDVATASPVLVAVLLRLGPFVIWSYVLLAIGLAVMGRIPRGRAAIAAFMVWVLGTVPAILGALSQPG